MFATHNSAVFRRHWRLSLPTLLVAVGCVGPWGFPLAGAPAPTPTGLLNQAQERFETARQVYTQQPTNQAAAWEFARACFDRGEFSTNDTERAALALRGIEACRQLLARDPRSAPGHYYLGMNLGQLARTKLLGALKIVDEMEREFKAAAALDERFDYGGPQRNLGLLYHEAPAIGSIGSRTKARKHFERAVEVSPDYPENRLNLAEAYLQWREKTPLKRELEALAALWPKAKTNFSGSDWEAAWQNWERRRAKLNAKAEDFLKR